MDLLKAESDYQRIRRQRAASESKQRITRARLAQALGYPGQLPADLATPDLDLPGKLPELDAVQKQAAGENLVLRALRTRLSAARERVDAAAAGGRPILRGRAETFAYSRHTGSSDAWRAGVSLEIPLATGGSVDAAVAAQKAKVYGVQADLEQAQMDVQQSMLETWMKLDNLRLQREEVQTLSDYRELNLDRSRALYELEARADLGDAMVQTSEAQLQSARTRFETALAWAKLRALMGEMPGARLTKDAAGSTAAPHAHEQEQNGS